MITGLVTDGLLVQGLATRGLIPVVSIAVAQIHFYVDPQGATEVDFDSGQSPFGPIDPMGVYEGALAFDPPGGSSLTYKFDATGTKIVR